MMARIGGKEVYNLEELSKNFDYANTYMDKYVLLLVDEGKIKKVPSKINPKIAAEGLARWVDKKEVGFDEKRARIFARKYWNHLVDGWSVYNNQGDDDKFMDIFMNAWNDLPEYKEALNKIDLWCERMYPELEDRDD